jgi:hypothetical protein
MRTVRGCLQKNNNDVSGHFIKLENDTNLKNWLIVSTIKLLYSNIIHFNSSTMKSVGLFLTLLAIALVSTCAFAPVAYTVTSEHAVNPVLKMAAFDDQKDRNSLTRDSEPEEYFQT